MLECETRARLRRVRACARRSRPARIPTCSWFDMTPKGLTERVRELLTTLGFRPHEGRARVVIFDPAHGLAPVPERAEAANVLLKTLEEPPADTHFILVTAEPKRLPVTVLSRCQRIRFAPPRGVERRCPRRVDGRRARGGGEDGVGDVRGGRRAGGGSRRRRSS